jgi:DNA polymerase-4
VNAREALANVLLEQTEQVAQRLRRHGLRAKTVTVKIRFGDFQTITRRCTLNEPTDVTIELLRAARQQFERWAATEFQPVRLIGMSAGGLSGSGGQIDLFPDPSSERQRTIDKTVDQINSKFGGSTIRRGRKETRHPEPD